MGVPLVSSSGVLRPEARNAAKLNHKEGHGMPFIPRPGTKSSSTPGLRLNKLSPFYLPIKRRADGETGFDGRSSVRFGQATCSPATDLTNACLCSTRRVFATL